MKYIKEQELEKQRYGRNKETTINRNYINSGEYRNKFDCISNNEELNRTVYKIAKKMLNHRSGTLYEDMYWIDIDTGEIVASEVNQKVEKGIWYSKSTLREIEKHKNLLVMHTHPNSMPPSIRDFNSAYKNGYQICLVCCHNGKIFHLRRFNMRVYENDTEMKIPAWYFKLPQKTLNRISDLGIILSRKMSRKKIDRTNKRNIKFNL